MAQRLGLWSVLVGTSTSLACATRNSPENLLESTGSRAVGGANAAVAGASVGSINGSGIVAIGTGGRGAT